MARAESDRFGELIIEDEKLYGVQTVRALENMSCSRFKMSDYPSFIRALALVKKAAALANQRASVISSQTCKQICSAADLVSSGNYDQNFPVDMLHGGGGIAFNQNINEVLARLAEREGKKNNLELEIRAKEEVNAGQSTADSCSTAFRLALLTEMQALLETLFNLQESLKQRSLESDEIYTVARTCLQDAMPTKFSSVFSAWQSALARQRENLIAASAKLQHVNLGATVIGSGEGASPIYRKHVVEILSDLSGYPLKLKENLFDAAQHIDELADLANLLATLSGLLIKICGDLRLLSSGPQNGFGELILPAVQDGSSFFSAKNNPVIPETVMQACFHVIGNQRAAQAALEHG
ncbi:MAG: hypothetical protein K2X27_01245, partial [Candidatus Obscuribacterales bacterium]|nr:hypothetical protein [Candidatus Obscuribacterales bacterium]